MLLALSCGHRPDCELASSLAARVGNNATDCGYAVLGSDASSVDACVTAAFNSATAFYARYDRNGTDSNVVFGIAQDAAGNVMFFTWDSDPSGGSDTGPVIDGVLCIGATLDSSPTRDAFVSPPLDRIAPAVAGQDLWVAGRGIGRVAKERREQARSATQQCHKCLWLSSADSLEPCLLCAPTRLALALLVASGACAVAPEHPATVESTSATRPTAVTPNAPTALAAPAKARRPKVIVFVWDGLRPDSVTAETTPNLARMRDQEGVNFTDQHAVYPTFTMMNAAAFATGAYPAQHGFYGNTEYQLGPAGNSADGKAIDFTQPVFSEDHGCCRRWTSFTPRTPRTASQAYWPSTRCFKRRTKLGCTPQRSARSVPRSCKTIVPTNGSA